MNIFCWPGKSFSPYLCRILHSLYSLYDVFIKLHVSLVHYISEYFYTMPVYVNCKLFAPPVAFVGENIVSFKDVTPNKFPLFVANPYFFFVPIFWNF